MKKIQEAEDEANNVIPFAPPVPKTASKPPSGPDWLKELPFGARFLCKQKGNNSGHLSWYGIASPPELTKSTCLASENPNGPGMQFHWVDSAIFSKQYEYVELLPEPSHEEEGMKETPDG